MKATCMDCGDLAFIQNKKGQCGECVFKKNHGGKSRQEVYQERADYRKSLQKMEDTIHKDLSERGIKFKKVKARIPSSYQIVPSGLKVKVYDASILNDPEGLKNAVNQEQAERREREDQGFENVEGFLKQTNKLTDHGISSGQMTQGNYLKNQFGKKKQKSIKQVSAKQSVIEKAYKLTCIDMDYITEPVCTGCLKYQGGDIKLSHSHIISRKHCKEIGREDLISSRENLTYHCLDFGENVGCHRKWESPVERVILNDYEKNLQYIKSISEETYLKYKVK